MRTRFQIRVKAGFELATFRLRKGIQQEIAASDDRGVPYHAESTLSSAQVLKLGGGATIFLLLVTAVPVQRDGRYPLGEHVTALFWECAPPLAQSRTQWLRRVGEQALQGCGTGAGR